MQAQQAAGTTPTNPSSDNGTPTSHSKVIADDEDDQVVFLNQCIENETIDFEKSVQDKRNATIDGQLLC